METTQICFEIPQNILYTLSQNQDEFIRQMRLSTAQYLFKNKKLTFGQAAELADMTKSDFLNELDISGIDLVDYDASELSEELARFQS
ncbi:UPF0175 family protein [Desulfococcaceae bacterium HSG8]|nr:UPF0175 family protein [Desulfococcaceae bacterium HSG8]